MECCCYHRYAATTSADLENNGTGVFPFSRFLLELLVLLSGIFVVAAAVGKKTSEDLSKPGVVEALGLDSAVLAAYDSAWRATAEDDRDGVHPIRYRRRPCVVVPR